MDSPFLGLVVDTSSLITVERQKESVSEFIARVRETYSKVPVGISTITVMELRHGLERAYPSHRPWRQAFLNDVIADMIVYPVIIEIAHLAGIISGQQSSRGINIPFEDLLIGATALHHSCEVLTENVRHFQLIPNLSVKTL